MWLKGKRLSVSYNLPLKTFLELFLSKYLFSSYWMSPFACKEIQPVHPKGNQPWIFTGRTDAEAEAPILWPPDVKSWLIGKDPDAGQYWRQQEKGATEHEMVGWRHQPGGLEFEQVWELVMDREAWRAALRGSQRVGQDVGTEEQHHWMTARTSWVPEPKWWIETLSLSSEGGRPGWYPTMSQFPPTQALN